MALTEAQAIARAQAVRATFPQGTITKDQAIEMLMAMVDSQVGYASHSSTWSMYGRPKNWLTNWYGRQVYWCALGLSWAFEYTFGAEAARAGIGRQATNLNWPPAGWTATWLWLEWFRENKRWVGMERAQPGDVSIQSWGRTGKESDHVEPVTGYYRRSDDSLPTTGFNTATGNPTAGAGVQRARRYRWHTVGIYRPDWDALVATYNARVIAEGIHDLADEVIDHLELLGYEGSVAGVRAFQKDQGLVVDGIVGKNTSRRLEAEVSKVEDRLVAEIAESEKRVMAAIADVRTGVNTVGRVAAEGRDQWAKDEERTALVKKILGYDLYGFSLHWWLRRGFLGRIFDHKNYPFDPGSPADLEHRTAEAVTGQSIPPYGAPEEQPNEPLPFDPEEVEQS